MAKIKDGTELPSTGLQYECSNCSKKFKYESEKKRHEEGHYIQHDCKLCKKKFSYLSALRRHEKQHKRTRPVQCSDCGGTFLDEMLLKRHMKYAHEGDTYNCEKCNASFASKMALRYHSRTHADKNSRKYSCSHQRCDKTFQFLHHLKHHELTHTNMKQHYCNVCGKGFIQAHHLKMHLNVHEPDKWLKCYIVKCNKKFTNHYALKRHILTHKKKSFKENNVINEVDALQFKDVDCPLKDHVLCDSCGQSIHRKQVSRHYVKCFAKLSKEVDPLAPDNEVRKEIELRIKSSDIISENVPDNEENIRTIVKEDRPNDVEIENSCKLVLGGCIASADGNINENCLCAKMSNGIDYKLDEDIMPILKEDSVTSNVFTPKSFEATCKDNDDMKCLCECSDKAGCWTNENKSINFNSTLEDNLSNNNIVNLNLHNTVTDVVDKKNPIDVEVQNVPYNSCKAILGNCIVSGDGTMGEECLCARMNNNIDESSQEIDEITCAQIIW